MAAGPPGTSARNRAQREKEREAANRAAEELLRIQDERDAAHPEEAAKRKAKEKAQKERENEKYWNRTYRSRKATPEEERRRLSSFGDGYREGENVSLNKQVDAKTNKQLS